MEDELKAYKAILQVDDLLETETSSNDVEKSNSHPDIFLAAMKCLGNLLPQDCVVVGDSPYEAEAAGKEGTPSVAFLCGGFPKELLHKAGFQSFYRDPSHLLQNYEDSLFHSKSKVAIVFRAVTRN